MSDIVAQIAGSEKLTRIFGSWPSFHDAEVLEMQFERDDSKQRPTFPRLTAKIHLWAITNDVDERGYYILINHTLATMRFHEIDDLKMEGFNHQNAIFGLRISANGRNDDPSPFFSIEFDPSFGVGAAFKCQRVEVISAVPWNA